MNPVAALRYISDTPLYQMLRHIPTTELHDNIYISKDLVTDVLTCQYFRGIP
jgi:hypothetical protein